MAKKSTTTPTSIPKNNPGAGNTVRIKGSVPTMSTPPPPPPKKK